MIKSADIQQLGVGLGSLSNIICRTYFFQEQQHGHPSFFRRYLQLNFLREQSTTDLPITVIWFISNDNADVICDTTGPKEKICYFQAQMPEANPVLSIYVMRVYIWGAVAW